jgi:hypothetical protein
MTFTYDVTAVSHDGQRVPLAALASYSTAHAIAQNRSRDDAWATVEMREAETGSIVAVYADGDVVTED